MSKATTATDTMLMRVHSRNRRSEIGWCAMTASIAILYATFIVGIGVLVAAWAWGDLPETGYQYTGRSPLRPDARNVLAVEGARDEVHDNPVAPLRHHA